MPNELLQKLERDLTKKRDFSLVSATLRGNQRAFETLMTHYKTRLFYFGIKFFHNEVDAEDFVQDVFIKVYTRLSTFQGKSQFSTWLMRVAYTTAINELNRRKETQPLDDEAALPDVNDSTPEEQQIRKITQSAIREAVQELPQKYAICIEMYFYYDIPYQEISDITELPLNTIKSHIFRAKKILKKKLEEYHEQ